MRRRDSQKGEGSRMRFLMSLRGENLASEDEVLQRGVLGGGRIL